MAITETITKIQFRRGTTSEREAVVLSPGEPGWDTEQKILYVGDNNTQGGEPCIKFNSSEFDLTDSEGVSLIYNGLDYNTIINNIRGNSSSIATTSRLGIIKVGTGLAIDSNGKLDVSLGGSGSSLLPVATQSSTGVVSVPGNGGIVVSSSGAITIDESKLDFSKVSYSSNTPSNPNTGDMWYNTTNDPGTLYIWSGGEWVSISTASSGDDGSDDSSGGTTTVTTVTDIINLAGGQAGNGDATMDIPVPAGDWLIHIQTQENSSSNDEDIVTVHSKKYNVPAGQYLWFKGTKTSLFKLVNSSQTPPSLGDSNWVQVEYNAGTRGGGGNSAMGTIWGFALKLESVSVSSGGSGGDEGITGKSVLLDQPEILYARTVYKNDVPQYIQDHYNNNQNPSTSGTISAGSQVPSDAVEVLLHCSVNHNASSSQRAGFFVKQSSQSEWKTIILNTTDSNIYPSTNSMWVPLDEDGKLMWKFEGGTAGAIHLYLLEIQGYRTAGSGGSGSTPPPQQIVDGQAVASYSSGWKKIDDPGSNTTTTVENGATLTYEHGLGTTDIITQIYVSPYADGSNARSLDFSDDEVPLQVGPTVHENPECYGATVTNVTTNNVRIQLAGNGYGSIGRNGLNYRNTTVDGHQADSTGQISFKDKYLKVVCFAPELASAPKTLTPSGGGWRHTEELTIDGNYNKEDILLDGIPRDATEVQIVLSDVYFSFGGAVYIGSQSETFTQYGGLYSTMFHAPEGNGRQMLATPGNGTHAFNFAHEKYSSGVIRMSRSVGDRWFIEFNVQGYEYKLTHDKGALHTGYMSNYYDMPNIATVSKLFENGLGKIYIKHRHTKKKYILTHGFIRFSYR